MNGWLAGWLAHRGSREEAEDDEGREATQLMDGPPQDVNRCHYAYLGVSGSNEGRARNDENRDETEEFDIELGA